jgi:phosphocarrier protein
MILGSPQVACPRPRPIEPLMSHDTSVARRQVEITNFLGLHLRPADKFVKLALKYQAEIRVHYNGNQFNGKSILDLTTLAAECGTRLELEARGPDAAEAIEALANLISAQFYENESGDSIPAVPNTSHPNEGHPSSEPAR